MQKNIASQKLIVFAFDSTTNLPKTGDAANITAYVSIDYGTVTILADTSATEMSSTLAKGYYLFDLAQAETNGNTLLFTANSTTSNIIVIGVPATVFTDPANYTAFSLNSSGQVDVIKLNGTSQTARDIGASVLLSSGTGTGQLNFTTGVVNSNATQIAGQTASAAGTVTFPGTIASPTNITAGTITTVTNLTNAPTAGDFTATMKTSITTAATASSPMLDWSKVTNQSSVVVLSNTIISEAVNVNNILLGGITAASLASSATAAIATATWQDTTAGDFTVAGSIGLGLFTSGNAPGLTNGLLIAGSNAGTTMTSLTLGSFNVGGVSFGQALFTTQMTESYATLHTVPTLAQILFEIRAILAENNVTGTTVTTRKIDGSTTAETYTIDANPNPTNITRAS